MLLDSPLVSTIRGLSNLWQSFSKNSSRNGPLEPLFELLTRSNLQPVLLGFLPQILEGYYSGNMAVDMFLTTFLATFALSVGSLLWKVLESWSGSRLSDGMTIILAETGDNAWNDNPYYDSLAWMVSTRVQKKSDGVFRLSPSSSDLSLDDRNAVVTALGNKTETMEAELKEVSQHPYVPEDMKGMLAIPQVDEELEFELDGFHAIIQFNENAVKSDDDDGSEDSSSDIKKSMTVEFPLEKNPHAPNVQDIRDWLFRIHLMHEKYLRQTFKRSEYEFRDGGWDWCNTLHLSRPLEALSLDENTATLVRTDLEKFFSGFKKYTRIGIPHRRGYILSGKPGTGKSSLIRAISASFNMNICCVNLKTVKTDSDLRRAFSQLPEESILVFEDIDAQSDVVLDRAFHKKTEKIQLADLLGDNDKDFSLKESKVTLAGILAGLDGHMVPPRTIIIMTSNHPERLDPALIRPGRIDMHLHMGYCTHYQLQHMYNTILDLPHTDDVPQKHTLNLSQIPEGVIPPCDAMRLLMMHEEDSCEKVSDVLLNRARELESGKAVGDAINTPSRSSDSLNELE